MLNIVNYILIQRAFISTVVNYTNMNIQRQLDFQKGKFEQLSESYRQNRRIIHDVKNTTSIFRNRSTSSILTT